MKSREFLADSEKLRNYFLEEIALCIACSLTREGMPEEIIGWRYRATGVCSLMRDLFYHTYPLVKFQGIPVTEEIKEDLLKTNWPVWFDKKLLGDDYGDDKQKD
jgi:hypothetical protein